MIYALDSNIISAILIKDSNTINHYQQKIKQGGEFIIPPIVFYEIERGLLAKNLLAKRRAFIDFCYDIEIGDFNYEIWCRAAQIYADLSKRGKLIGSGFDGDVFIAAYCIYNKYTLVTKNKRHFERIDGLLYECW